MVEFADSPVWETGSWPGLPELQGDVTTNVCVIGLGGSGLSAIGELLRMGQRVVGLDASDVGSGAAGHNGGFLLAGTAQFYHHAVALFGKERACRIYRLTMAEIDRMAEETAVRKVGSLRIAASAEEERDCRVQLEAMRSDGLPAMSYEGPEGRGLLIPTDGAFDPLLRCRVLAKRALDAGANLFAHSVPLGLSGNRVLTAKGSVHCERTLIAVDGRLEEVLPELRGRVRTARLQMIATAPEPEVRFTRPVYARWGYEYWQQLPDGRIALGGFRDLGGDAEWTCTAEPSEAIQRALEDFLRLRLNIQAPVTHRWASLAAFSRSGLPIVEEVRPNLWAIGAYNGTGNVMGALCGRGVTRLMIHGKSDLVEWLRINH